MPDRLVREGAAVPRSSSFEVPALPANATVRAGLAPALTAARLAVRIRTMSRAATRALTFGEIVERGGVFEQATRVARDVIRRSDASAAEQARVHLYVITCDTCTATKACCSYVTSAYLFEAIPIAARLIREHRDTPALRKKLRDVAEQMESERSLGFVSPCVFLDAAERCTIYEDRPSVCARHLVSSPAEQCAIPGGDVAAIQAPLSPDPRSQTAVDVADSLGLEPIGTQYCGLMPRMVLICLEAWPRRDFVRFLAKHGREAAQRMQALVPAT